MAYAIRATEKVSNVTEEEELRKRGYATGTTLGEGSYAKVKSAFSEKLEKKVALKIINRRRAPKDFLQKFLPRELEVMKMIRHPNIIELYEVMQFGGKVFLAMELAGHGDLLEYIRLRGAVAEDQARIMFHQLVSAVQYLHSINIVHRDLKCENILLDSHNSPKISDFGFTRLISPQDLSKTFCGSAAYAAPEILQGIPYKATTYDVWSLGVILYIMVCGSMPYDDTNIKKMIRYQKERKVGFSRSRNLSEELKDLIHSMLEAEVPKRATISDVLNSAWIKKQKKSASPPSVSEPGEPPTTTIPANIVIPHVQSHKHPKSDPDSQPQDTTKTLQPNQTEHSVSPKQTPPKTSPQPSKSKPPKTSPQPSKSKPPTASRSPPKATEPTLQQCPKPVTASPCKDPREKHHNLSGGNGQSAKNTT